PARSRPRRDESHSTIRRECRQVFRVPGRSAPRNDSARDDSACLSRWLNPTWIVRSMVTAGWRSHLAARLFTRVAETALLRIGILLGVMPRMLHDVVRDVLDGEQDLRIVAENVEVDVLVEHVERERPDVVVLAAQSGLPPAVCAELLSRFPRLTVVTLEDRGERASIYTQRPIRFRVAELSGPR